LQALHDLENKKVPLLLWGLKLREKEKDKWNVEIHIPVKQSNLAQKFWEYWLRTNLRICWEQNNEGLQRT